MNHITIICLLFSVMIYFTPGFVMYHRNKKRENKLREQGTEIIEYTDKDYEGYIPW